MNVLYFVWVIVRHALDFLLRWRTEQIHYLQELIVRAYECWAFLNLVFYFAISFILTIILDFLALKHILPTCRERIA